MPNLSPNALGSIAMACAGLAVTVNDALLRSITDDGPGPYQVPVSYTHLTLPTILRV